MAGRRINRFTLVIAAICVVGAVILSFLGKTSTQKTERDLKPSTKAGKAAFSLEAALPKSRDSLTFLDHKHYLVGYNKSHKQAAWVAYLLTADMVQNNDNASRKSTSFKKDYLLNDAYALREDYKGSGYVRGHLCPSKDMCHSFGAMKETFYLSNVSPQIESFNNGLWKKLETQVRQWALDNDSIIVITGPVLSTKCGDIGENHVSVCGKFYKIIVDVSYPDFKMIGFVMENRSAKSSIYRHVCTVRDIERLTGLDFFPTLCSNTLCDSLETTFDIPAWQ